MITVTEQSSIQVRSRYVGEAACLDASQALILTDLGERMGARIVSWQGPDSLRVHQFVGVVRSGDLQLEILPKLDGLDEPAQVRQSFLKMLALTQDLEVHESERVGYLDSSEPFICALARLYCRRLLEAVRRGLRQEYVLHHDLLPQIRGKIDWPGQVKLAIAQRLEFSCSFDERSEDTPLNRILKAALQIVAVMLEGTRTANMVNELRHAMDGVSETCPPMEQVARVHTDRMNRHLEPLLALAKLILGNSNPDLGRSAQGDRNTYALIWDMNVLFEEYVGRLTQELLEPQGFRVDRQEAASVYLAQEAEVNRSAFLLCPDILLRWGQAVWGVADTKWKRLDPRQINLGVSAADIYQVLAYAQRYETDQALLIYPHHPGLRMPGLQREFVIQGTSLQRIRVKILTVDLARLELVPEQLETGFTTPSPRAPSSPAAPAVPCDPPATDRP